MTTVARPEHDPEKHAPHSMRVGGPVSFDQQTRNAFAQKLPISRQISYLAFELVTAGLTTVTLLFLVTPDTLLNQLFLWMYKCAC
jgi:hypothetical protein